MLTSVSRVLAVTVVSSGLTLAGAAVQPSYAEGGCQGRSCASDGPASTTGSTVTVTVTGDFVSGGSAGPSGSTSVTVPTPCGYLQGMTGKEYAEWVDSGEAARLWHRTDGEGRFEPHPGYEKHRNDDNGHWYGGVCSSKLFGEDLDAFFDYADEWFKSHDSVYVPASDQPPVPPVPGVVLAQAAQEAMTIPEPAFHWNPTQGARNASFVNLDTWFWLDEGVTRSGSVTATAGRNSATVEVDLTKVTYAAPAEGISVGCTDGGTPWSAGADSSCVLRFRRASEGTTVDANATWTASWRASDGTSGTLDITPTGESATFAVDEIGSVVTAID